MSLMSHAAQLAHHRAHISDVPDTMAFIAHLKSLQLLTKAGSPGNVHHQTLWALGFCICLLICVFCADCGGGRCSLGCHRASAPCGGLRP